MPKCSFSGKDIPPGTGKMYVRKDGKVLYFDSSKSMKNYIKLGRKPRDVKWTQEGRKAKEEELRAQQDDSPKKKTVKKR